MYDIFSSYEGEPHKRQSILKIWINADQEIHSLRQLANRIKIIQILKLETNKKIKNETMEQIEVTQFQQYQFLNNSL